MHIRDETKRIQAVRQHGEQTPAPKTTTEMICIVCDRVIRAEQQMRSAGGVARHVNIGDCQAAQTYPR